MSNLALKIANLPADANLNGQESNKNSINNITQDNNIVNSIDISIDDLKSLPIWVCWKYEERDGDKTKVPYNARTGGKAQSDNPETWTTFDFAQSKVKDYDGIGFNFTNKFFGNLALCGIDFDNKKENPELDKQDEAVKNLMNTYAEITPSGKGKHYIFLCDMSKIPQQIVKEKGKEKSKLDSKYYSKNPYNGFECYFAGITNRYFSFTGDFLDNNPIAERTEQALIFIDNYMLRDNFKKKKEPERVQTAPMGWVDADIVDKIRKSKQGYKFSALFDRGDVSAYNNDDSAADMGLCSILAWWLQGDFNEIDRYFRQSRLYRDKWERVDYKTSTINKAIEGCGGKFKNTVGRPKKEKKKQQEKDYTTEEKEFLNEATNIYGGIDDEKITIAGVALHLNQIGVSIRYNEIVRKAYITGVENYNNNYIVDSLPVIIYNQLNPQYMKCPKGDVMDFIKVIMMNNAFNPVIELIDGGKWDGKDRLPELFNIMRISDSDKLSKILIEKWFWQNISMARNDRGLYGADGLLVLKGTQGIGKTTFARKAALLPEFFGEGLLLDVRDKDSVMRAVSCWVGELGEIESTFKSDINALKAFISLPRDNYRVPYGRTAEDIPRRTSYIGTCNSNEYLIDETGNRRYWTIPINERMDLNALEKFDMLQLYLQVNEKAKNNVQGFRLTREENTQLAERNSKHEKPLKAEMEIRDILYKADNFDEKSSPGKLIYSNVTVSDFKKAHSTLKNYSVQQIAQALTKVGIEEGKQTKVEGKNCRLRRLPIFEYGNGKDDDLPE